MIRLEIEGKEIHFTSDISFTYIDYNPLVDAVENKGGMTLDIDVDLRDSVNAQIYKHINRVNVKERQKGREAKLWVDGKLFLKGTETILSVEGYKVKIQLLTGNSEVNFAGSNTRISELDLGSLPAPTVSEALFSLDVPSEYSDYVCCPVMVIKDAFPQKSDGHKFVNFVDPENLWDYPTMNTSDIIPQPYMVYVIEKVFNALGWKVAYNVLRDDSFSRNMILVHGKRTLLLNEIIPDWKVNDFIEEVQKFFNVVFITDSITKTVSIYNVNYFYENIAQKQKIGSRYVLKDNSNPSRNFEADAQYSFNYEKMRYDFPEENYYNRADVDEEVDKITDEYSIAEYTDINNGSFEYRKREYYNKPYFLRSRDFNLRFVLRHDCDLGNTNRYFAICDQFKTAYSLDYDEEKSDEVVLKIMPAQSYMMSVYLAHNSYDGTSFIGAPCVVYAENNDYEDVEDDTSETNGLNEWIDGNVPKKKDTSGDKLFVAQYVGIDKVPNESHEEGTAYDTARYPQTYTCRFLHAIVQGRYNESYGSEYYPWVLDNAYYYPNRENDIGFSLEKHINTRYKNDGRINTKEEFEFEFVYPGKLDPQAIYIIHNRKFVAKKFEYKMNKNGMSHIIRGTFLPFD